MTNGPSRSRSSRPPPLGPGALPLDRLIAYGRARIGFLIEHREIARAALDGASPYRPDHTRQCPSCTSGCCSGRWISAPSTCDMLAVQLSAALDGPLLLYLSADDLAEPAPRTAERIARAWHDLIRRACRP